MYIKKNYKNSYLIYTLENEDTNNIYLKLKNSFNCGELLTNIDYVQNGFTHPENDHMTYHFEITVAKSTWSNLILKRQIKRHIEISKKLNLFYYEPILNKKTTIFIKNYYNDYLSSENVQPYIKTYNTAFQQLVKLHELKYAHGNIRPKNIVFFNKNLQFVNFECTVSQIKRETHCKKIDLKFASLSLIKQHNIKYPRRNFENAILDDYEALILTFIYLLIGQNDAVFLENIELHRHLSMEEARQYIEDGSLPPTFHPYILEEHFQFKKLLANLHCVRYKIKDKFNGELFTKEKD